MFKKFEAFRNSILSWFKIYSLKAIPDKFQFMFLGTNENYSLVLNIGKNKIKSSTKVALLEIKIDKKLKFKSHIEELQKSLL